MILKGIIQVTGEHDTGKTTFALECGAQPEQICFFDDDIKGRATVEEMREEWQAEGRDFGAYHDLVALARGKKLLEFHAACLELIDGIQPDQFEAIVWDTWSRFGSTFRHCVFANPNKFRRPGVVSKGGGWADRGDIKGAEMNKEGTLYEAAIIGQLAQLAPTVVLVTHLKADYFGKKPTGKEIPDSSKTLQRVPRMRVWLRQNPDGRPVPIGLFLKRFDRKIITSDGLRTICIIPRKITPSENERSLWDSIWRYWENPVDSRKPLPEETPNEFELSILDGTLTTDQRRTFNLMLQARSMEQKKDEEIASATSLTQNLVDKAREMKNNGNKSLLEIARATGLSVAEVAKL